jgi:acetyltransferase
MATDALIARDGKLATISQETIRELNEFLPPSWSHSNPADVLGDAPPDRFTKAVEVVLKDEGVDAVLAILTPQAMTDPTGTAKAMGQTVTKAHKPVLAAWMGSHTVSEGVRLLNQAGIPTYAAPEHAVRAFMHLVSYGRNLEMLYETPRDIPVEFGLDRQRLRGIYDTILAEGDEILSENVSKALLEAYGIPVTRPHLARSPDEAVQIAHQCCGYPVVLKIHSPQITHKTDVGGVVLSLGTDDAVREAFGQILRAAAEKRPDAQIVGVTVQKMITCPNCLELIIGTKKDPLFGAVIMVGAGGVSAEVFCDRAMALPPINEALGRRMLKSLKSWPLLQGYRGKPPVNIDRLIEILMRFSYLVADYPKIKELDINPLLVTPEDVIALDARVILDPDLVSRSVRPFSHLAIRPYPEEYVAQRELEDETSVILRPIKPEDEPMWHDLLANCSEQSIWFRFSSLFKQTTHRMATRYCFIDYDREIGIVAEVNEDGRRKLIGVGRLVADADHDAAEYAVIIVDRWHGHGLGGMLTDYCVDVAKRWGVNRVVAETSKNNTRMLDIFRSRGFEMDGTEDDVMLVSKTVK